jgi:cystathionine beta-lyase/cystathionine gamma-synthase
MTTARNDSLTTTLSTFPTSAPDPFSASGTSPTWALETAAIHAGLEPDPATGAILTPIHQTATYVQRAVGEHAGYTYTRAGNPTVAALERNLAALDGGTGAVAFASGLAALHALLLACCAAGDHVVASEVLYGGTARLLRSVLGPLGIRVSFVDTRGTDAVERALEPRTKLVLVETPANPTLVLADVTAIAALARSRGIPLAVDNTFLTPVLQRTFELGADVAVYSTTKFVEGHNATIGGAVVARSAELVERLRFLAKSLGAPLSPFESWLTLRGITTLPLRVRRHSENALQVARFLEDDPRVTRVAYPFLESFPQLALARRQQRGGGGVLAFEVRGGDAAGIRLMNALRLCSLAESLGAVETLVTHPASMTHGSMPREERERLGISDGLVRLSIGLEAPSDVIADLDRALDVATARVRVAVPAEGGGA